MLPHRISPPWQEHLASPAASPRPPKSSPDYHRPAFKVRRPRSNAGPLPQRFARRASTLPEGNRVAPPVELPLKDRRRSSSTEAARRHCDWQLPFFDWPGSAYDREKQNERLTQGEHDRSERQCCTFSRSPCGVFRSMSHCLSANDTSVESELSSPEVQEAASKPSCSSVLLGKLNSGRLSKRESAVKEKPFFEYVRNKLGGYWGRRSPQQEGSPQSAVASPDSVDDVPVRNRKRSASECLEETVFAGRRKRGTSRGRFLSGAESTNRRRHSSFMDEQWAKQKDKSEDGVDPHVVPVTGGVKSSKKLKSRESRFAIPNHGRPFLTRPRRWTTRMNGVPRRGGCVPVRPYWPPYHYRYRVPFPQPFVQQCTCFLPFGPQAQPPPLSSYVPTAPSSGNWRTLQGQVAQQVAPCKACEDIRYRAASRSRDSGLRERLRAEERIKRLEEEMSIHERSREEEAACQEEIREAQETARLERELLIADAWCKSRGRDDFYILEADTAVRGGVRVQALCRVLEETGLNDGRDDANGTTACDEVTNFTLEPNDKMSELLLTEPAIERRQREEWTAYDDMVAGNRPTWYRARCSVGDVQEFDRKISVESHSLPPSAKEQFKRRGSFSAAVQEKTTPRHNGPEITFTKDLAWLSDFVLSPSKASSSQEPTRTFQPQCRTRASSSSHSLGASTIELSVARNLPKREKDAHSDNHVPSGTFRSAEGAKETPSEAREHLITSLSSSRTLHDGCAQSICIKLAASKVQVTVNTESQTAAPQKSTMFLASSVDDSKCVARETGGPVYIDAHTRKEARESASLAPTSEVLSSGLYVTAAEGPATQATKSEVSEEAPKCKNDENGEDDLLPPTEGATQTENRLDDAQGEVAILSDPLVVSKQASGPQCVENMETASNFGPAAGDSASRQPLRSPPPEVQAGAVESPPAPVPVTIISGNGLLLIVACLLILWFTIVIITAAVTRHDGPHETAEHTSGSFVTTARSKAPAVSGVYLCKTEACLREGAYLNSLLSGDIRPCSNFYQYVCERWLPERAAANATFKQLGSRDTIIEAEMEDKSVKSVTSNPEYVRPVQALLQACNDRPLASSAMAELRKLFHQWNMHEWPLPPYATRPREDVWTLAGDLLRDLGLAAIVDVFSARDPSDDRGALVAVDSPEPLYFPRGDVAGSQIVRAALKEVLHLFDVVDALSVDRLASDVIRVFDVLETLYQPVIHDEAEVLHLSEMDAGFGKLINRATRGNKTTAEHQGNARVLVLDPKLTNALPGYLGLVPTQAILNYLIFRALVRLAAFLPDSMSSLRRLSYVEGAGRSEKPETLSLCLRTLERAAPSCFLRALAQPPSSMAALRRHWLSDLESVLHRALPRIRWLDALSRTAVAERLRLLRIDASFIGSPTSDGPCAAADVRVLRAPMAALVEVFRRRPLQSLTSWWRRALPLTTWPSLDLPSGYLVHVPPGLINDSVPANGSLLFAFHLTRVAVRLYAAMMPILYAGSLYDRSLPLTDMSERRTRTILACLNLGEWHQWAAPLGSNRDSWLRRWLLDQTLALELGLLSFRELSAAGRVWELDTRFANLAEVTSTQLFFVYYALDHCERRAPEEAGDEHTRRELLLRRRLPSPAMVNLPLRNMPAFAEAFECVPGDYLRADWSCLLFQQ